MGKVWTVDTIIINFSKELDFTASSMGFGDIRFFIM